MLQKPVGRDANGLEMRDALNIYNRLKRCAGWSGLPGDMGFSLGALFISPFATLTIGRQPSSEGPGAEFKENRLRQSTYPALLFDGEADGIVATFGLQRFLKLKNSAIRIAYGKGYQSQDDKTVYLDGRYGLDDLNVFGTFSKPNCPVLSAVCWS